MASIGSKRMDSFTFPEEYNSPVRVMAPLTSSIHEDSTGKISDVPNIFAGINRNILKNIIQAPRYKDALTARLKEFVNADAN